MGAFHGMMPSLLCRDCPHWYGAEDDGYGPCTIKSQRGEARPLTYGAHVCDEGYDVVSGQIVFLGVKKVKPAARPPAKPARKARAAPAKRPTKGAKRRK